MPFKICVIFLLFPIFFCFFFHYLYHRNFHIFFILFTLLVGFCTIHIFTSCIYLDIHIETLKDPINYFVLCASFFLSRCFFLLKKMKMKKEKRGKRGKTYLFIVILGFSNKMKHNFFMYLIHDIKIFRVKFRHGSIKFM